MERIFDCIENDNSFLKEVTEEIKEALLLNIKDKNVILKQNIYEKIKAKRAFKMVSNMIKEYEDLTDKYDKEIDEKNKTIVYNQKEKKILLQNLKMLLNEEKSLTF